MSDTERLRELCSRFSIPAEQNSAWLAGLTSDEVKIILMALRDVLRSRITSADPRKVETVKVVIEYYDRLLDVHSDRIAKDAANADFVMTVEDYQTLRNYIFMMNRRPKFENVSCSNCGRSFGPGNHGFSHCDNHKGLIPKEPSRG